MICPNRAHPSPDCGACSTWVNDYSPDPISSAWPKTCTLETAVLLQSADNGCPISAAIVAFLDPVKDATHIYITQWGSGSTLHRPRITISKGDGKGPREVFCTTEQPCPWGFLPFDEEIKSGCGPAGSLRVAAKWITDCVTGHKCGSTGAKQPLPSRLLKVIGLGDELVKLVETNGEQGRYVCLSHCWGAEHTFETTNKTLDRFLEGFPIADMPPTYSDAVTMTRMLGIPYLWIDSLCIIQDNDEDWRREAVQMANVYSNAFLTLAATWGSSNSTGMFREYGDMEVTGTSDAGVSYRILCRQKEIHPYREEKAEFEARLPLLTRGWVFQERLLSSRVLHFGPDELFWECLESITCECGRGRRGQKFDLSKTDYTKVLAEGNDRQLAFAWRRLVVEYSRTRLTRHSDRLPALSGVAKQFQQRQQDPTYLAGLWRSSLLEDMLWAVSENHEPRPAPMQSQKWRAPSWSWASLDAEVHFHDYNPWGIHWVNYIIRDMYSQVQHIVYNAVGDDTGEVESGLLTIRGPVLRGLCTSRTKDSASPSSTKNEQVYDISISVPGTQDVFLFSSEEWEPSDRLGRYASRQKRIFFDRSAYVHDKTKIDPQLANKEVVFLGVLSMRLEEECIYNLVECILLLQQSSENSAHYERIGLAVIEYRVSYEPDSEVWEKFPSLFRDCRRYETVTIV